MSSDFKAFSLAHRIMDQALVPAHDSAVDMNDLTVIICIRPQFANDLGIIAIGYKADLLTVRFESDGTPHFLRNRADLALGHTA